MNSHPRFPALLAFAFVITLGAMPHRVEAQTPATELTEEQIEKLVRKGGPKIYLPKLIDYNKAKLQRIYEAKLEAAETPEYAEALKKSQEAWEKYYEADRVVGAMDTAGGSGQAVFAQERHVYQLRLRIFQLSTSFLQGWPAIPEMREAAPAPVTKP